jgi:hypothetical protein
VPEYRGENGRYKDIRIHEASSSPMSALSLSHSTHSTQPHLHRNVASNMLYSVAHLMYVPQCGFCHCSFFCGALLWLCKFVPVRSSPIFIAPFIANVTQDLVLQKLLFVQHSNLSLLAMTSQIFYLEPFFSFQRTCRVRLSDASEMAGK